LGFLVVHFFFFFFFFFFVFLFQPFRPSLCHMKKTEEKRSHRSRYSLNTEYSFGNDASRQTRAHSEFRDLLDHFDNIAPFQRNKLLRSGTIPPEMIGELWMKLSSADDLLKKNAGVFDMLVSKGRCAPGDEEKIVKGLSFLKERGFLKKQKTDIARTFPDVQSNPRLQTNLFNVLKAYSVFDPDLGYCQVCILEKFYWKIELSNF
jgi:hypothetical protein